MQSDLNTRNKAIPYYANIWGYNRTEDSDQSITGSVGHFTMNFGDLENFQPGFGTLNTINPIRILQPHYGDIINANLTLVFTLASAEIARQFRIAIGYFGSNYAAETNYTQAHIDESHKKITGRDSPYQIAAAGSFTNFAINLTPALYKRGDALFQDDAFVLLLVFDQAPSTGAGWTFTKCNIDCTMQMGLL